MIGFLLIVVVIAATGVGLLAYRHRPEGSIESGIRSFRREMRALAPPPDESPAGGAERDDPSGGGPGVR